MPDTLESAPSGRYPSDMENRVAVLEQIARTLLSGQERIERRFEQVDRRFDEIDRRFDEADRRFAAIDQRVEAVDRRFEAVDRRFEGMDRWIDLLTSEHRTDFRWLVALILAQTTALLGVMAHGFHWL